MFGSISQSITTLVVAVGALLQTNLTPVFDNVNIEYSNEELTVSTKLINCFNDDIDKILLSGQDVRIDYQIQVLSETKKVVAQTNLFHQLKYDLIDENFVIFISEEEKYSVLSTINSAKEYLTNIRPIIVMREAVQLEKEFFFIVINARIKPIFLDSIGKKFDLLNYWNNKPATYHSNKLKLRELKI